MTSEVGKSESSSLFIRKTFARSSIKFPIFSGEISTSEFDLQPTTESYMSEVQHNFGKREQKCLRQGKKSKNYVQKTSR